MNGVPALLKAVQADLSGAAALLPIPGEWIIQGGAVGLLMLVAYMVFTGRLVPRQVYRDMEKDRDQWREVALKAIGHNDQLLPAAQITTQFVQHLSERAPAGRGSFDAAAVERALGGGPAPDEGTP